MTETPRHPAPFSDALMPIFAKALVEHLPRRYGPTMILDPFAGSGKIHELALPDDWQVKTVGVELMPKWARRRGTIKGDATRLSEDHPEWLGTFDAVVTSPCYGNRMADHHDAQDKCSVCKGTGERLDIKGRPGYVDVDATHRVARGYCTVDELRCPKCDGTGKSPRRNYKEFYGDGYLTDAPLEVNAGAMHWGDPYRTLHEAAWGEAWAMLKPRGIFILNIKDHIRGGSRMNVSQWHRRTIEKLGFARLQTIKVPLAGFRHGENNSARIDHETVYVFQKVGR